MAPNTTCASVGGGLCVRACMSVQGEEERSTDDLCIESLTENLKQITQVNSFYLKWKLHCTLRTLYCITSYCMSVRAHANYSPLIF